MTTSKEKLEQRRPNKTWKRDKTMRKNGKRLGNLKFDKLNTKTARQKSSNLSSPTLSCHRREDFSYLITWRGSNSTFSRGNSPNDS